MEGAGILYVHLGYSIAIWYILWPFGIIEAFWYIFRPFWYVVPRKIWQPCHRWRYKYHSVMYLVL
jgi:4-hydroxybenzoate polyprenyltransferase